MTLNKDDVCRRLVFTGLWAGEKFCDEGYLAEVVGPSSGLSQEVVRECRTLAAQNGCGLEIGEKPYRESAVAFRVLFGSDTSSVALCKSGAASVITCVVSSEAPHQLADQAMAVWARSETELCVFLRMAFSPQGLIGCDFSDLKQVIEGRVSECRITTFDLFGGKVGWLEGVTGAAVNFSFHRRLTEIDTAINVWRHPNSDIDLIWQGSLRETPVDQIDVMLARAPDRRPDPELKAGGEHGSF